ncbi:sserine/threonine protein kinase with PASTA sensor domain [Nitzschia inconspicua]|uniref:non-specific serine/threonine protein kinase n=1 Tax=Nitzschia inconspicua TaxID=303405 RepID=A0A9K3KIE9_9STRA|nr:sserine/threonine protein kinase with PASTA sensor domain [Nitzschia inconspicua]
MDDRVLGVLFRGAVKISSDNVLSKEETAHETLSRHLSLLESWLGLPTATDWDEGNNFDMMEEAAPFDTDFYKAVERMLIDVWNPEEASQKYLDMMDFHRQQEQDPQQMSLYSSVLSIRVTRLLRYWLDLNVMGREKMDMASDENGSPSNHGSLTFHLLKLASVEELPTDGPTSTRQQRHQQYPLIQALYQHVEQLPYLQSKIYLYTQALMRGGPRDANRAGLGLSNPQARLEHMQMSQRVTEKLDQEFQAHIRDLEFIIGEWYSEGSVDIRRQCRAHLGSVWSQFVARSCGVGGGGTVGAGMKVENTSSSGIDMTLRVLHRILLGTSEELLKSHEHLLFHHLNPLHRPNSMVLWRDQTSLLDLYHEPLVQCMAVLLQKKPEWTGKAIAGLLEPDVWSKGGNTPKIVLLLHEIDTYIGCLPDPIQGNELGETFSVLLRTLGSCMASENSRLAQRALPFVKNQKFVSLLKGNFNTSLNILLPFLLRKELSWNPTVQKMTYNVLATLQSIDNDRFVEVGDAFLADSSHQTLPSPHQNPPLPTDGQEKKRAVQGSSPGGLMLPKDYTVKSAMGSWRPPPSRASLSMPPPTNRPRQSGDANPPLSVTGVAPWAMIGSGARSGGSAKNPPIGVTGVAPWAMKNTSNLPTDRGSGNGALSGVSEEEEEEESSHGQIPSAPCGVISYMEKIKPPEENKGASSWSQKQMAETPTLLPTLKFHDLVFGHDLGSGSFGSVRYARLIDRATTRSNWPEYAVKIISTEKIKEMGYEAPVQRELAVLRMLSHPCISRLVSSFRFHDGVYLILEYAGGGDLHTLLRKNGSLDHNSTRFVIGEVTSALSSIHDLGLVYADLKPENIVISETGHIKLTDFGGSRPVTEEARKMVRESARNALQALRDGDWKIKQEKKRVFDMDDEEDNKSESLFEEYDPNEDLRIEGTTNYLPPEVVLGAFPGPAADSWALGCVMYQCLTGRPPIIEEDDARTKSRIISFDASESQVDENGILFADTHASNIEFPARALILSLLSRLWNQRPTMTQVAEHGFFQEAGIDVFSLYKKPAHPLDVGDVAPPSADVRWSRRQLSSIWAPQPQAYNISLDFEVSVARTVNGSSSGPIAEGAEGPSFFSKSNLLPSVQSMSLPPSGRKVA